MHVTQAILVLKPNTNLHVNVIVMLWDFKSKTYQDPVPDPNVLQPIWMGLDYSWDACGTWKDLEILGPLKHSQRGVQ